MNRTLIINADDFGYSDHTVDWTIRCFERGVLSSATIMAGASATRRAVEFANQNPQWSFGLHLCLTDERSVCQPEEIPSMVSQKGLLWPTRMFILRSSLGLIKRGELEKEIRAQVNRLRDLGGEVSHLDGHGHMHRVPFVLKSLIRLSNELRIACLRPAQDLYYSPPRLPMGSCLNRWVNRSLHKHFNSPDHFLMTCGKVTGQQASWFSDAVPRLPDGCTEIGVHPGMDTPWRKLDTDFLIKEGVAILAKADIALTNYHCFKG